MRGRTTRRLLLGLLAALWLPLTPAARAADQGVAVTVNDEAVTTHDLSQRMRLLVAFSGVKPDEASVAWLQRSALNSLIEDRLKTQEFAKFRRLDELKDDVETRLAQMGGGSAQTLLTNFSAAGIDPQSVRDYVLAQEAWRALVRGRYGSRVRVSDDQVAQAIARAGDATTAKYRVSGLFLSDLASGGHAPALVMAQGLVVQARGGAEFAELAAIFSDPGVPGAGGEAVWTDGDALEPEVLAAAQSLAPGVVSDPIETRDGVWVITVIGRFKAGDADPPAAPSAEEMSARLADQQLNQLSRRYLRELRNSAVIEISAQ